MLFHVISCFLIHLWMPTRPIQKNERKLGKSERRVQSFRFCAQLSLNRKSAKWGSMSLKEKKEDWVGHQKLMRMRRLQLRASGLHANGTDFVQRARRSLQRAPLTGEMGASAAASLLKMSEAEHCQPQHVFCEMKELQETRNRNIPQKCAQRRVRRCLFQIRN